MRGVSACSPFKKKHRERWGEKKNTEELEKEGLLLLHTKNWVKKTPKIGRKSALKGDGAEDLYEKNDYSVSDRPIKRPCSGKIFTAKEKKPATCQKMGIGQGGRSLGAGGVQPAGLEGTKTPAEPMYFRVKIKRTGAQGKTEKGKGGPRRPELSSKKTTDAFPIQGA